MRWLGLENINRVRDLGPVGSLRQLEGLSLEGSMWSTWRVSTLQPLGSLTGLRYLSLVNLRSDDATLEPLFALRHLEAFHAALWWADREREELRRRNPKLAA